jgi:hypothetical protein
MAAGVRNQFETLLGDQLITFLGQYSATAAGNAASFALSEENRKLLRSTRRKVRGHAAQHPWPSPNPNPGPSPNREPYPPRT